MHTLGFHSNHISADELNRKIEIYTNILTLYTSLIILMLCVLVFLWLHNFPLNFLFCNLLKKKKKWLKMQWWNWPKGNKKVYGYIKLLWEDNWRDKFIRRYMIVGHVRNTTYGGDGAQLHMLSDDVFVIFICQNLEIGYPHLGSPQGSMMWPLRLSGDIFIRNYKKYFNEGSKGQYLRPSYVS